jgi:hypothetical protein
VACGYFKATKKFFAGRDFHCRDLAYVCQHIEVSPEVVTLAAHSDRTRERHACLILKLYGFRAIDQAACRMLEKEVESLVRSQLKPKLIHWRCVALLVREKI